MSCWCKQFHWTPCQSVEINFIIWECIYVDNGELTWTTWHVKTQAPEILDQDNLRVFTSKTHNLHRNKKLLPTEKNCCGKIIQKVICLVMLHSDIALPRSWYWRGMMAMKYRIHSDSGYFVEQASLLDGTAEISDEETAAKVQFGVQPGSSFWIVWWFDWWGCWASSWRWSWQSWPWSRSSLQSTQLECHPAW